jgi:NAD-dependent dihydropyrimidine dehydrogenase PreA subunit
MPERPIIDEDKCDGCGLCVSVCACGGLEIINKVVTPIASVKCGWCAMCELVCPSGAISCPFEIISEDDQDA